MKKSELFEKTGIRVDADGRFFGSMRCHDRLLRVYPAIEHKILAEDDDLELIMLYFSQYDSVLIDV